MALSAELEALITELEKVDKTAAADQRALLEKHASLQKPMQEGVLRQTDYSRKLNEQKTQLEEADKWKKWADKNFPIHEQLVKDYSAVEAERDRLRTENTEMEAKIKAAVTSSGTNDDGTKKIDEAELTKRVREQIAREGVPTTKAELSALIQAEAQKLNQAATDKFFKETFPQSAAFITGLVDVQWKHRDEFGKPLDREKFAAFMTENKIADPATAYDRYVGDERRKKEIDAEVQRRLDEVKKTNPDAFAGSSGPSQGHFQIRLNKKGEGDPLVPATAELGDGTLAMAAAAEMRGEGRI
jgi:hypothetical protein